MKKIWALLIYVIILIGLFSTNAQADIAINSGGNAYTASDGTRYLADTYYSGGIVWTDYSAISGTTDDPLYQTQRYGGSSPFSYNIPVTNGSYEVTFKFCELYYDNVGDQIFNVTMEGVTVISNLDILAHVPRYAAYDITVPATVSDGTLNITFTTVRNYCVVNAIKVVEVPPATVSLTASPESILSGESSTLSWNSTDADTVEISGIGPVALNGSLTVSPLSTTTYIITATNSSGSATDSVNVTVIPVPSVSITASPNTITAGENATLNWTSSDADEVSIDNGIGTVTPIEAGSVAVNPVVTTAYTVTATNAYGVATDTAIVTVSPVPIVSITASPNPIVAGGSTTLTWSTTNADIDVYIDPLGIYVLENGSYVVSPLMTTTYTITATGSGGSATDSVQVVVNQMPVVSITATPNPINAGGTSTLSWAVSNADSVSIDQSVGTDLALNGIYVVSPAVTTTYTITAENQYGTSTDSVEVVVNQMPTVSITASPSIVNSGDPVTLSWTSTGASTLTIDNGVGSVVPLDAGSVVVSPSVSTNYTIIAEGAAGSVQDQVTVTVIASIPPPTVSISANPQTIEPGDSATLTWSSTYATSAFLDDGISTTSIGVSGSMAVSPTETTGYTIVVMGNGQATDAVTINVISGSGIKLETGVVSNVGGSSWTRVNLSYSYNSMVVVATPDYDGTSDPGVTRIRNASGSSFDVRVDPAGGTAPAGLDVYYMVVEEGVYTQADDGVTMEAVKFLSTRTDENNSWVGEARTYQNTYSSPVVLGQVMTYNDPDFSYFWARGSTSTNPPSSSSLYVGKAVGEDPDVTRANETIGYVVIQAGSGTIEGIDYIAYLGPDTVRGVDNSATGYTYSISGISNPYAAVLSAAGMDGGNGGWPVLYGSDPISATSIDLVFDEDVAADTERNHSTEQVAYAVFGLPVVAANIYASPSVILTGESAILTWSTANATSVILYDGQNTSTISASGSMSTGALTETTTYTITALGPGGTETDSVTVTVNQTVPTDPPTATITASPNTIMQGGYTTLTWTSTDADMITISPDIDYPGYSGNEVPPNGSYTVQPDVTTTYTIIVTGPGGSAADTVTVTINMLPTVNITASPGTIAPGQTTMLNWTSTNANQVSIDHGIGTFTQTSGSVQTDVLNGTTVFTITATNVYGSVSDSVTVYVSSPPTVAIIASPNPVVAGNATVLAWTSTNSTSCSIDPVIGTVGTNGNLTVTPLNTTTYTITAQGDGGTASDTVTVTVISQPPTVDLRAEQAYLLEGGSTTLSWIATNAVSGTIEDIVGGNYTPSSAFAQRDMYQIPASELSSGVMTITPDVTTTYIITVNNSTGSTATDYVQVQVANNPPVVHLSAAPNPITSGDTSTLTWTTEYSTDVTLDDGTGTVSVNPNGSMMINPLVTTTYTITATSEYGSDTDNVTVTVSDSLSVNINAYPNPIKTGDSTELIWSSNNATSAAIDNGIGGVAVNGSYTVSPSVTTVYTITVTDGTDTRSDSICVTVREPVPTAKIIASSMNIANGEGTTITWLTQEADIVEINSIGYVQRSGAMVVYPNATTTYTVTATNSFGSATDSVTVGVNENVPVIDIYVDPMADNPISAGESTRLVWEGQNVAGADIIMNDGESTSYVCQDCSIVMGNITVAPTQTTTYTVEAVSGSGDGNSDSVTIVVEEPPIIENFAAIPPAITFGEFSILAWEVFGADEVYIDNGIGRVDSEGNAVVQPLAIIHPLVTTTYTIIAINEFGMSVDSTTVSVAHKPTVSISADPATIIQGDPTTLSWTSTDADTAMIDNGIGEVAVIGDISVNPDVTTTYTITVIGPGGISNANVEVTVLPLPEVSISAIPEEIIQGESTNLSWTSVNADTVNIDNGVGEVVLNGSAIVSPRMSTTYTITASRAYEIYGGIQTVTAQTAVTVIVNPIPTVTLSANPADITLGESSTLSWSSTDALDISIDNNVGTGLSASGTAVVSPLVTTTYTVTATNAYGSDTATTTIIVHPVPIVNITANYLTITFGGSTTLSWTSQYAETAIIDQNIGTVVLNGSTNVSPTVTTTYTINASSQYGSDTDSVTITVTNLPTVEIVATPDDITAGESSTISWSTVNADPAQVTIDQFGSVATEGSQVVSPAVTTTYTITAINAYGSDTMSVTVTVHAMPTVSISASPATINEGASSVLTWSSTDATTLQIDQGIGTVSASGSTTVTPTVTTTYTITASNTYGSVSDSVVVTVSNWPSVSIDAFPTTINIGETSTLTWNSVNAATITIDNGIGTQAAEGSYVVSPTDTTTYTITAQNSFGTVTDSVQVTVNALPIVSFTVDDAVIDEGNSTTLRWSTSGADSADIDQGIGTITPNTTGTRVITPTVTTTYTLTATNTHGSVSRSVTVTVENLPSATITATPSAINIGESATLSWSTVDATSILITPDIGVSTSTLNGSATVSPTATSTYTITATNSNGSVSDSVEVTVNALPVITTYAATPATITQGSSSDLTWSVTDADTVQIDQGIGEVANPSGTYSVSPTVTTTYKLTATNTHGSVNQNVTITVNSLPSATITATPSAINIGESATLSWSTVDATSILITPDIGVSTSTLNGSATVSPTATSTYTITATNSNGSVSDSVQVTVNALPVITNFTATQSTITQGQSSTLEWNVTGATTVSIDQGIGTVTNPSGTHAVSPTVTTTYTLTATNTYGTDTGSVTVTVNSLPSSTITASPTTINNGESATLSWSTVNADTVEIDNGVGTGLAASGTATVTPDVTTMYTITAGNTNGTSTDSVTITVNAVPVIDSFTATPASIDYGNSSDLSWSVTDADTLQINQGIGAVANPSGTHAVNPTVTTTYTLTATNTYGSDTLSVTVTVNGSLPIATITATPTTIAIGGSAALTWSTVDADTVEIDNGVGTGLAASGTATVTPTVTTTYTITADNAYSDPVTDSVTVNVIPMPVISTFTVSPSIINEGSSATLSWTTSNATSVSINQGIGAVANPSGTHSVNPTVSTTYTMTASNLSGSVTSSVTITVVDVTLTANPATITEGSSSTLSWTSTNAATLSIDNGIGTVAVPNGTYSVSPTVTTMYTITATNGGVITTDTATVTVTADPTPHTVALSASPVAIEVGNSATLSWTSTNATMLTIDNGIGTVEVPDGTYPVSPESTTTYTIIANSGGIDYATDTATVTVIYIPTASISTSASNINEGESVTLSWSSSNASSAFINNGIGAVTPNTTGSSTVSPAVTTTYTITASNSLGTEVADSVTITVTPTETVTVSLSAIPTAITEGSSSILTWSSANATTVSIDQGIGTVDPSGTRSVSPTVTTTYTITAINGGVSVTDTATVTVSNLPVINSFSASPATITEGENSMLSWNISGATSAIIDHGVGTVSVTSGTRSVSPTVTTTYLLTASNSSGSVTDSVTITVSNLPTVTISATPTTIAEGSSSTLTWTSTNATSVSIDQGIGTVSLSGTQSVSPTITTTYTITATNGSGFVTDTATVTVGNLPTVGISTSTALPIVEGGSAVLSWTSSNATSVSIDHGVGTVTPNTTGTSTVWPTVTTTYIITASNSSGSVTDSVTITVGNLPTVSLTANPTAIAEGSSSILSWTSTNATSVSIDQGIGTVSANGSQPVSPTVTTTYTITATNGSGSVTDTATVTVSNLPVIGTFTASPAVINDEGGQSTLNWIVSNADSVSIDHGIGTVSLTGTRIVQPTVTTTYTLTATNTSGTSTRSVTITVNNLPVVTLVANPAEITEGSTSILSWTSTYATSLSLDNGIGTVATSGSIPVQPVVTTTYTITASNTFGSRAASATVTVRNLPNVSISASPTDIVEEQSSTLTWTTSGADEVSIDQNIGTVSSSGSLVVTPIVTTTYTITATNENGSVNDSVTITVRNLPTVELSADPLTIDSGSNTTLTWTTTNATSVSIDQGIGTVELSGSRVVNLTATTTFTITATNANGFRTDSVTIIVEQPPAITSFTITPNNISQGTSATLNWATTGATSVSIDQGIGTVGASDSAVVWPSATTTYTITADNSHGSVSQSITITVTPLPTVSIESDPAAINSGSSAKLIWSSTGAITLSIDQGIGTVAQSGSMNVTPLVTTTYTITATNANGSVADSVTVTVNQLPVVSIDVSVNPIIVGSTTTLSWSATNADSIIITPDIGVGSTEFSGTRTLLPTETTTYMITATNSFGSTADSVTLTVYQIPTVVLTIDPPSIVRGESATISWTSQYADAAEIDHGIGVVGVNGSSTITPDADTTFTITVTGPGGVASDTETIIVLDVPVISFSADPVNIISGDSSTLSWTTDNADTVIISDGEADYEVDLAGSMSVTPTKPTIYTLVATGQGGEAIAQVQVGVVPREAAYIPRFVGNEYYIDVMDLDTNTVTYTLEDIGHRPYGVIADPSGDYLYVSCLDDASVNKINAYTGEVAAEIDVYAPPRDMVITPDGSTLYVSTHTPGFEGTVIIVDTALEEVVTNIGIPRFLEPSAMDITPDGSRVYVCDTHVYGSPEQYNVSAINTQDDSVVHIPIGQFRPIDIAVSPNGSRVYVIDDNEGVLSIDTGTNAVSGPFLPEPGKFYNKIRVSADSSRLYIASYEYDLIAEELITDISVISTSDLNSVVDTINLNQSEDFLDIKGMSLHPSGQYLYVVGQGTYNLAVPDIFVVNVGSGTVQTSLATGEHSELWGDFLIIRP